MNKLLLGFVYGFIAQVLTFLQLQGNIKWNWYHKYPIIMLGMAVPISWLYIKSVEAFVHSFNGEIWPSRLIGFAIGIIVFALMSYFLFKEPVSTKTLICIVLAMCILGVQIFWK
jgi:multidrug transporter EmrE-like cation transporter